MSERKVNFIIWSMYEPEHSRKHIKATRIIDDEISIRNVVIGILKEQNTLKLGMHEITNYDELPLIIKPMNKKLSFDNFYDDDSYTFGPKYLIKEDGSVMFLRGLESIRDWKLDQLDELYDSGYIDYKQNHIIVVIPEGLGATGGLDSIIEMTSTLASVVGIGRAVISAPTFIKYVYRFFSERQARRLAKQWANQGIRYPFELREFLDLKAGWKLNEIKTRLKLNEQYSVKLLMALGFEPVSDEWKLTHSKNSIRSRKRWIANERYWNKKNMNT